MKKAVVWILSILVIISVGGYLAYRFLFPQFIAEAVTGDNLPAYIPRHIKNRIEEVRGPINENAKAFVEKMYTEDVSLDQVLQVIDNTTEEQVYAALDELNATKLKNTNQVFDIAKKHIEADFDLEPFRQLFNEKAKLNIIKKSINYANINRRTQDVDIESAKVILKKILIQKEKELLRDSL